MLLTMNRSERVQQSVRLQKQHTTGLSGLPFPNWRASIVRNQASGDCDAHCVSICVVSPQQLAGMYPWILDILPSYRYPSSMDAALATQM
jgi:hypothetical protein